MGALLACLRGPGRLHLTRSAALFEQDRVGQEVEMRVTSRLKESEELAVRLQTLGLSPVVGASEAFFSVFRPDTDSDEEDVQESARVAAARVAQVLEREARAEVTRERARGPERGLDDLSTVLNAPSPSSLSQSLLSEP
jgi:hypothetical protein